MNEEQELIEKAKKLYPIGTKFICPRFVRETSRGLGNLVEHHNLQYYDNGISGRNMYYLYYKGNWAKITEYPKNYVAPSENLLSKLEIW